MVDNYNFLEIDGYMPDIQSIIHLIAQEGEGIIGLELGIFEAASFVGILQGCKNVKHYYGVDSWQPYIDKLMGGWACDKKEIERIELMARHRIKWSGEEDRATIIKKDSNDLVNEFSNEFFDFIFVDTYMSYEQAKNDFNLWYSKCKPGGLFCGHDVDNPEILKAVEEFRKENNITNHMSIWDRTFVWRK